MRSNDYAATVAPIISTMDKEQAWVLVGSHATASVCAKRIESTHPTRMHPHHIFKSLFNLTGSTDDEYVPDVAFAFQTKPYVCLLQTNKICLLQS